MRVSEKYCPWINKDLRDLMRTRDKLKKSAVKGESPILMDSYRQIRNKVDALNVQLKKQYYNNRIAACKGNMKESWKTINELLNKRSKSSNIDCLKESGTETMYVCMYHFTKIKRRCTSLLKRNCLIYRRVILS